MTNPSKDLLATTEGVDEGSAASTAEGDPITAERRHAAPGGTALRGGPEDVEAQPAPPVDMEGDDVRAGRDARGTGQQLEAGEG